MPVIVEKRQRLPLRSAESVRAGLEAKRAAKQKRAAEVAELRTSMGGEEMMKEAISLGVPWTERGDRRRLAEQIVSRRQEKREKAARQSKVGQALDRIEEKRAWLAVAAEAADDGDLLGAITKRASDRAAFGKGAERDLSLMTGRELLNEALGYGDWRKTVRAQTREEREAFVSEHRAKGQDPDTRFFQRTAEELSRDFGPDAKLISPTIRAHNAFYLSEMTGLPLEESAGVYDSLVMFLWGGKEPEDVRPLSKMIRGWYSDKAQGEAGIDPDVLRMAKAYVFKKDEKIDWRTVFANIPQDKHDLFTQYVYALTEPQERGFFGKLGETLKRGAKRGEMGVLETTALLQPEESDVVRQEREKVWTEFETKNERPPFGIEIAQIETEAKRRSKDQILLERKARQAQEAKDEVVGGNILSKATLAAAGIVPDMAASAGLAAATKSPVMGAYYWYTVIGTDIYQDMRGYGFSDETSEKTARVLAIPVAFVNQLQTQRLLPKFSGAAAKKAKDAASISLMRYIGQKVGQAGTTYVTEMGQETIEGAVEVAGKVFASVLSKENPQINWWEDVIRPELDELKQAAWAFGPLVLAGTGVEARAESKFIRKMNRQGVPKNIARAVLANLRRRAETGSTEPITINAGGKEIETPAVPKTPYTAEELERQTQAAEGQLADLEKGERLETELGEFTAKRLAILRRGGNREALDALDAEYGIERELSEEELAAEAEEKTHPNFGKMANDRYIEEVVGLCNETLERFGIVGAEVRAVEKTQGSDERAAEGGIRPTGTHRFDGTGRSIIELAFQINESGRTADAETAVHESIHPLREALERSDDPEAKAAIATLNAEFKGDTEAEAAAGAEYIVRTRVAGRAGPRTALEAAWEKIIDILVKIRDAFIKRGYRTAEDVFDAAWDGKFREKASQGVAAQVEALQAGQTEAGAGVRAGEGEIVDSGAGEEVRSTKDEVRKGEAETETQQKEPWEEKPFVSQEEDFAKGVAENKAALERNLPQKIGDFVLHKVTAFMGNWRITYRQTTQRTNIKTGEKYDDIVDINIPLATEDDMVGKSKQEFEGIFYDRAAKNGLKGQTEEGVDSRAGEGEIVAPGEAEVTPTTPEAEKGGTEEIERQRQEIISQARLNVVRHLRGTEGEPGFEKQTMEDFAEYIKELDREQLSEAFNSLIDAQESLTHPADAARRAAVREKMEALKAESDARKGLQFEEKADSMGGMAEEESAARDITPEKQAEAGGGKKLSTQVNASAPVLTGKDRHKRLRNFITGKPIHPVDMGKLLFDLEFTHITTVRGEAKDKVVADVLLWAKKEGWNHGVQIDTTKPTSSKYKWVFYVDSPEGQLSFHVLEAFASKLPVYKGSWFGERGETWERLIRLYGAIHPVKNESTLTPSKATEQTLSLSASYRSRYKNTIIESESQGQKEKSFNRTAPEGGGQVKFEIKSIPQRRAIRDALQETEAKLDAAMEIFDSYEVYFSSVGGIGEFDPKRFEYASLMDSIAELEQVRNRIRGDLARAEGRVFDRGFSGSLQFEEKGKSAVEQKYEKAVEEKAAGVFMGQGIEVRDRIEAYVDEMRKDAAKIKDSWLFDDAVASLTAAEKAAARMFSVGRGELATARNEGIAQAVEARARINRALSYQENRPERLSWFRRKLYKLGKENRSFGRDLKDLGVPMISRIEDISPEVFRQMRRNVYQVLTSNTAMAEAGRPFLEGLEKLQKEDFAQFTDMARALFNSDWTMAERIAANNGITDEMKDARAILEVCIQQENAVGMDVKSVKGYWPRWLIDMEGFMRWIEGSDARSAIDDAIAKKEKKIGRKLQEDEVFQLVNTLLRGFQVSAITLRRPGWAKERSIEEITGEMMGFFATPQQAFLRRVTDSNTKVAARVMMGRETAELRNLRAQKSRYLTRLNRLTGKTMGRVWTITGGWKELNEAEYTEHISSVWKKLGEVQEKIDEMDQRVLSESVGAYVARQKAEGFLKRNSDEAELQKLMRAAMEPKEMHNAWLKRYRNIAYATTLANPKATLTQLKDQALSFYRGPGAWMVEFPKAIAKKSEISFDELGVGRIAQELSEVGVEQLTRVLMDKAGFTWVDTLGKTTLMNTILANYRKQASRLSDADIESMGARTTGQADVFKRVARFFGDEKAVEVIRNLRDSAAIDADLRFLLFCEVCDVHPVTILEMPYGYAMGGDMKIGYMMKSFTLRQIDFIRRECLRDMKRKETFGRGFGRLLKLAGSLILFGTPVEIAKDIMYGKEPDIPDAVLSNLLQYVFFSKYTMNSFMRDGLGKTLWSGWIPPTGFLDAPPRDIKNILTGKWPGEKGLQSLKYVPLGGELLYWWLGAGRDRPESML